MMKPMMRDCCGPDGEPDPEKMAAFMKEHDRSTVFDVIGWGSFFIWVGIAWLMGYGLGWGLLGVGILTIGLQALRFLFHAKVESFWLIVGMAFVAGGFWELWSIEMPLAPVVLIMLGIGLLLWYFTHKLTGRKRMF
jgi:hypothetical protein